jgi:hypothetical protein
MNRQRLLLLILLGVLALALAYAFWATPRQQRVPADGRPAATPRPGSAPPRQPEETNRLRLELLTREEKEFPGATRDIFRFFGAPPVEPPPPPPPVEPPPLPPEEPLAEEPVTPEVRQELAQFTFLGYLQKNGIKTVFLSSNGEIFVVKKGNVFGKEKRFQVTGITPEQLTIRQGDDPRPITIPLVEQAPLIPGQPGGRPPAVSIPRRPLPILRGAPAPMPEEEEVVPDEEFPPEEVVEEPEPEPEPEPMPEPVTEPQQQ